MRAAQRKRMRLAKSSKRKSDLKTALEAASSLKVAIKSKETLLEKSRNQMQTYKNMARCYWERWRWESQKRKESLTFRQQFSTADKSTLPQIDTSMLNDVSDGATTYIGRGSYGIVKLQLYRGIYVAVKQFLARTFVNDVINEAKILLQLSHPYVLCCFGVCTNEAPYRIVTQFEVVQHLGSIPQS